MDYAGKLDLCIAMLGRAVERKAGRKYAVGPQEKTTLVNDLVSYGERIMRTAKEENFASCRKAIQYADDTLRKLGA